jgi:hypothetical protein
MSLLRHRRGRDRSPRKANGGSSAAAWPSAYHAPSIYQGNPPKRARALEAQSRARAQRRRRHGHSPPRDAHVEIGAGAGVELGMTGGAFGRRGVHAAHRTSRSGAAGSSEPFAIMIANLTRPIATEARISVASVGAARTGRALRERTIGAPRRAVGVALGKCGCAITGEVSAVTVHRADRSRAGDRPSWGNVPSHENR